LPVPENTLNSIIKRQSKHWDNFQNGYPLLQFVLTSTKAIFAHLDVEAWLIERDAKLAKLKELIAHKIRQPTTNKDNKPNRQILIFTAFADTATYLYKALVRSAWINVGCVLCTNKVTYDLSTTLTQGA